MISSFKSIPGILILGLYGSIFVLDFLAMELELIPRGSVRLPEICIMGLVMVLLAKRPKGQRLYVPDFCLLLLLVSILGCITAILSGQDWFRAVVAIRNIGRFAVLAFVLANLRMSDGFERGIIALVLVVLFIQIPATIVQWGIIGRTDDGVSGTLRSTGSMAILMLFLMLVVFAAVVHLKKRPMLLILIPLICLPSLLGEGKFFFFVMPLLLALAYFDAIKRRPIGGTISVLASVAAFWYAIGSFGSVEGQIDLLGFLREKLHDPFGRTGLETDVSQMGRTEEILSGVEAGRRNFGFGEGLGSWTSFGYEVDPETGTRAMITTTAAVRIAELGLLGGASYLVMWLKIAWSTYRFSRRTKSSYRRFVSALTAVSMVLLLISLFYSNIETPTVSLVFWTFIGLAYRHRFLEKRSEMEALHRSTKMFPMRGAVATS